MTRALLLVLAACGSKVTAVAPANVAPPPPDASAEPDSEPPPPETGALDTEASDRFDAGDYEGARADALEVLRYGVDETRMIRIVVSSDCLLGDADDARVYWAKLTDPRDRDQMATRCARYGITLTGSP